MWIIFVLFLSCFVSLNNIVSGENQNLEIDVQINNVPTKSTYQKITYTYGHYDYDYDYEDGDNFTLTCKSKFNGTLKWKLQQSNQELMVSTSIGMMFAATVTLDIYDHNLLVICEASNKENNESITIRLLKGNRITSFTHTNTLIFYKTEGEPVINNFGTIVFKYHSNFWKEYAITYAGQNIYDSITTSDNGDVFTAWQNNYNSYTGINTAVLTKIRQKVIIIPREKPSIKTIPEVLLTANQNSSRPTEESTFPTVAVITSVVSLCVVIFITFGVYCKYFKKRQELDDHYEHIYSEPLQVVYAQIDLDVTNSPAPKQPEAEPYAKIIGILKPKRKQATNIRSDETK